MRYDAIQESFLAGEISPRLLGRVDLDGYKSGAKTVENMVVHPHGGINRRGGFKFVKEVSDSSKDTILVELAYKAEFFYIFEFGENYIRVYRNQAYVAGADVTTTYTEAQLRELRFCQDEEMLYIFHKDHLPAKLHRHDGHDDWHLDSFIATGVDTFDSFSDSGDHTNGTYENVSLTGGSGSGVTADITVSGGSITDCHVNNPGTGYAVNDTLGVPTGTIGGTPVAQVDVASLLVENPPSYWAAGNYPTFGLFFEQRLWTFATPDEPNSVAASKSADYFNFDLGTGLDNESIQILVKDATKFMWGTATDQIMLGAHNGEFLIVPAETDAAITPSNVRPVPTTHYGSSFSKAIKVDTHTIFLQRGKRKFRRTEYKLSSDTYAAKDITILSEHITKSGITDIAFANEPDSFIWGTRDDGELVGLTYEPEYDVFSWHRHTSGGTDAKIISVAVSDGASIDRDELWAIIERTIDGGTVKYVEFMVEGLSPEDDQEDAFFVDSGVTKTGSGFTTFDGLDHLEGETVSILADGAVQAPKTVSSGEITLDTAADKAHAGLSYPTFVDPIIPGGGNPIGTSEGKIKRATKIALRLYRSLGFEVGEIDGTYDDYFFGPPDAMNEAIPLFTGDTDPIGFPGGHSRNIALRIRQNDPLPLNILAIMYELSVK